MSLDITFSGGHDNQILAEASRGVVEAIADGFGAVTLDFSSTWRNALWADRVGFSVQAQGTDYLSGILGVDGNLILNTSWQKVLNPRSSVQLEGLGWVFRREKMEDFNLNVLRASGRFTFSASKECMVGLGWRYQHLDFTERIITPDTTRTGGPGDVIVFPVGTDSETDRQSDAVASATWHHRHVYVSLEVAYRWAYSNEPQVEYTGPQGSLRLGSRFSKSDVVGYLSAASRDFSAEYIFEEGPRKRRDHAVQLGIFGDRALGSQLRVFVDASWLRQHSDIEDFTFNQAQIRMGLKMRLLRPSSGLETFMNLGPALREEGPVIFRYPDEKAQRVSVVGDFNGWNPAAHAMHLTPGGVWEVAVELASGIWRYSLIVDGKWVTPPGASQYEEDGFGGKNGVLIVQ